MNIPDKMNCWGDFPAMVGYAACYEALAIICTAETVQVVATLGERKAMHKAALAIAEMKKLEMGCKKC